MNKIYKYPLHLSAGIQYVSIPKDAEIVYFAMQGGQPCIWAKVDPYASMLQREFWVLRTGMDIPDNFTYIGTTQQGPFVWHLFEEKR